MALRGFAGPHSVLGLPAASYPTNQNRKRGELRDEAKNPRKNREHAAPGVIQEPPLKIQMTGRILTVDVPCASSEQETKLSIGTLSGSFTYDGTMQPLNRCDDS